MARTREDKLAIYEELIADTPDLELKGKATRYTSMNGNMFSFLSPEGTLAVRLPAAERTVFLERFPAAVVEQYGSVMKDYVGVSDRVLADGSELRALFERCVEHARTLRPKPTTRKAQKKS